MSKIRITKEFHFEAAHALMGYDGPCRNVHGHSYHLSVTIMGEPITDPDSPKCGMVMDFGDLKRMIRSLIIDPLDHALILNSAFPVEDLKRMGNPFSNLRMVDYQPTSENMLIDFAEKIRKVLPFNLTLISMRLRETDTSFAEWFAEDN